METGNWFLASTVYWCLSPKLKVLLTLFSNKKHSFIGEFVLFVYIYLLLWCTEEKLIIIVMIHVVRLVIEECMNTLTNGITDHCIDSFMEWAYSNVAWWWILNTFRNDCILYSVFQIFAEFYLMNWDKFCVYYCCFVLSSYNQHLGLGQFYGH